MVTKTVASKAWKAASAGAVKISSGNKRKTKLLPCYWCTSREHLGKNCPDLNQGKPCHPSSRAAKWPKADRDRALARKKKVRIKIEKQWSTGEARPVGRSLPSAGVPYSNTANAKRNAQFSSESTTQRMTPEQADVLGSHIANEWVQQPYDKPDGKHRFPEKQARMRWPHEEEEIRIPMPKGDLLQQLKTEFYQRQEGQDVGPVTRKWRDDIFAWATQLKSKLFGASKQVTG